MGTHDFSFPGVLSCFIIFRACEACVHLSLHHIAAAFMHENYEASKTGPEKETKDASSIVDVELYQATSFFPKRSPDLFCRLAKVLTIAFGPSSLFVC